jgi:hypothetical protein
LENSKILGETHPRTAIRPSIRRLNRGKTRRAQLFFANFFLFFRGYKKQKPQTIRDLPGYLRLKFRP